MIVGGFLWACARVESPGGSTGAGLVDEDLRSALDSIRTDDMLQHVKVLASDDFEGRAPGTRGEQLTVNYLIEQFRKLRLQPGNPDGTYVQEVPLVGFTATPTAIFVSGRNRMLLEFPEQYVALSRRFLGEVKVESSDMIFVGYGVVAPEYGWDDYKGVDVKGKTLIMLINDPPVPDARDPSKLDEIMFKGRAMTYYGRWTYKYEIASEKGAAAAIIVHETGPAGYPYEVISGSQGRENFDIQTPDQNMGRVPVESWITFETARKLFTMVGQDFEALKKAAVRIDFKPVPLNAKANFVIKNALREIQSRNVISKMDGSDPKLKDEYVIYTAHWDHLGKDEKLKGDQVFNGAIDNASGTASLLEMAEAFTKLARPPKRSILFLSVTAEEKGLLGAKYYAESPLYPSAKTLANINMDGVYPWGRTRDIVVVGLGQTTLDDVLVEVAGSQGRVVKPDPEPEKGMFYRSDHFEFAKTGVPALDYKPGTDCIGRPDGYGIQKRNEYYEKDYHKVSDEIQADWDLSGAVEDLRLLLQVGHRVANEAKFPQWKSGTEFRARREETLK
ncbi:MAG: M28 family peptidase [Acidobacteria bacterium]|nr:M28 family peptidase [Acidobacteriota bacterium]